MRFEEVHGLRPGFQKGVDAGGVEMLPRFAFEKYRGADDALTTAMKSVGEAMAIGRNFQESFQKALCSLETG
ncbi:MAG: hypothetical protein AAFU55_15615, partial [Pseudomonadota bacterium]